MRKLFYFSIFLTLAVVLFATNNSYAQDDCGSATQITITDYCTTISGTTINAGTAGQIGTDGSGTPGAAWFFIDAPSNATFTVASCLGGVDTEVAIHKSNSTDLCTLAADPASAEGDDECELSPGGNAWASQASFEVSTGNYAYVEWGNQWSNGPFNWNITYDCAVVNNVSTSSPSTTEATITFDAPTDGSGVLIEYGVAGFTQGTGTVVMAAASPFTISGLLECTSYDVYYYADCLGLGVFPPTGTNCTFSNIGQTTAITQCACGTPASLTVTDGIPDGEANASWTNGGGESNYTLEWGGTGFAPGTGAEIGSTTSTGTSYTATGLLCGATYEFYVKDDCPSNGGTSAWLGPIAVTISCPPQPPSGVTCTSPGATNTVVFSDEMDDLTTWTGNTNGGNGTWMFSTAGTGSGGTGPSAPHSGSGYIYYEASGPTTATASMVSTAIDLTSAVDGAELTFFMHAFGAGMGTLDVNIGTAPAGPFTNEYTWSGGHQTTNGDPWYQVGVDLSAYVGQTIYIEFNHTGINNFEGDMAIDLVEVTTCAICTTPTAAFSVAPACATNEFNIKINLSDMGNASSLDVVDGGGNTITTINAAGNYTIGPFTSGTSQSITLVHDSNPACDLGQSGLTYLCPPPAPTGVTCTSPGANSVIVFSNEMDDFSAWTGDTGGTNGTWGTDTNTTGSTGTGPSGPQSGNAYIYYEASGPTGTVASIVSPAIDLTANLDAAELSFYMHAYGIGIGTLNVGIGASAAGPFTTEYSWTGEYQTAEADPWSHVGVNLDAYLGQTIFIEFSYGATGVDFEGDLALDLVEVTSCIACAQPTATFTVVPDCNNNQFSIDVDITNLGDGAPLNISDGTTNLVTGINATGVETVGPFADGSAVDLTIVHSSNSGCDLSETGLTALCGQSCATPTAVTLDYCIDITGTSIADASGSQIATTGDGAAWFSFVAPASGNINVNACNGGSDTELAFHDVGPGGDCSLTADPATAENDDNCATGTGSNFASEINSTVTAGNTYYIEWGDRWDNGPFDWSVTFDCADGQVTGLAGAATGETTADITFTSPGASDVVLEYGLTGFMPGTGTLITAATSPYNITGLSACGVYDVYVNYDCLGTGVINSCKAEVTTFSTNCPCPEPTGVTAVDAITDGEITASWTNGGGDGSYDIEWGITGFAPGTGAEAGSMTSANLTETISGLTCDETYDVYVRDNCAGPPAGTSIWVLATATVVCPPPAPVGITCTAGSSVPIFSNEMDDFSAWTGDTGGGNGTWGTDTNATGSTGTGPSGPQSGGAYIYYEASGPTGTVASLVSPAIDLTGGADGAELTFYMHAFGNNIGTLNVGIGTSAAGPFTTEWTWTGQWQTAEADPWSHVGVNLDAYLGQTIFLEFSYAADGVDWEGDLALDLVEISTCVSCTQPTATFNVVPDCVNNQFSIDVDITNLGDGAPLTISDGTTNLVTGINATGIETVGPFADGTVVDLTIVHGANATCDLSQTGLTATCGQECGLATDISFDYCLDFTGTTITDATGSQVATTGDGAAWFSFTATADGSLNINACNGGSDTELAFHDVGAGGDCSLTANPSTEFNDDNCDTGAGSNFASEINTTVTAGNTYYIEWGDRWDNGPFDWSVTFDCADGQVTGVAAVATGENTADVTFTSPGASNVVLEYGPSGFMPGTGTLTAAATSPHNITGLSACGAYDVYINYDCIGSGTINSCKAELVSFSTDCPCSEPTGVTAVDGAVDGEATVSWTNGGGDGSYDIEWGLAGFAPGTGAEVGSITASANLSEVISGLTCTETYDIYVRDNCAGPPAASSIWTGPATVTIACAGETCNDPIPLTFDYCIDITGTTIIDGNGSQISTTGDGAAWFSFTAPADGSLNINACNGGSDTQLSFHNSGAGGNCSLLPNAPVSNDDACATGLGNNFASEINTTITAGNNYYIEWGDRWDNGPFDWSITFDCADGQVSALAGAATGETSLDITFTSPGASDVVLEYGPTGFTPGMGTTITGVTSPHSLSGLSSCTEYDVYVNYDCLGTGTINACKAEMISIYTDCPCGPATVGLPTTGTFNAIQYCDDVSGWTYYRDPANPGESLFAIEWDPGNTGNNAAAQAGSMVTIVVDAAPTMVDDGTEATWSMARYWNVTPGAAVVDPVNVRFFYDPAEKTAIENAMNADGRPTEGFDWFKTDNVDFDPAVHVTGPSITSSFILTPAGTGQENGVEYVQFDGITSFSGGTGATGVGPTTTPVPVELLYFTGKAMEDGNLLNWETASESNNSHFEVESSIDGSDFRKIGMVQGNGTSSENQSYSYTDPTDYALTYYRLKQVDFDGSYEYSNTVIVRRSKGTNLISIHPNPSKGDVYLTLLGKKDTDITIQVTDVLGRVISTEIHTLNGGEEVLEMDYNHFAIGTYYITVDDGETQLIQKWVKH